MTKPLFLAVLLALCACKGEPPSDSGPASTGSFREERGLDEAPAAPAEKPAPSARPTEAPPVAAPVPELPAEMTTCRPGDSCVYAGEGPCSCGFPVNAKYKDVVDRDAKARDCKGITVRCSHPKPMACVEGHCLIRE